jgi:hypothetical protein
MPTATFISNVLALERASAQSEAERHDAVFLQWSKPETDVAVLRHLTSRDPLFV